MWRSASSARTDALVGVCMRVEIWRGADEMCVVLLLSTRYDSAGALALEYAVLECMLEDADLGPTEVEVLDAQFFDDDTLVVVFRPVDADENGVCLRSFMPALRGLGLSGFFCVTGEMLAKIGTVRYAELLYESVGPLEAAQTREGLAEELVAKVIAGDVRPSSTLTYYTSKRLMSLSWTDHTERVADTPIPDTRQLQVGGRRPGCEWASGAARCVCAW